MAVVNYGEMAVLLLFPRHVGYNEKGREHLKSISCR